MDVVFGEAVVVDDVGVDGFVGDAAVAGVPVVGKGGFVVDGVLGELLAAGLAGREEVFPRGRRCRGRPGRWASLGSGRGCCRRIACSWCLRVGTHRAIREGRVGGCAPVAAASGLLQGMEHGKLDGAWQELIGNRYTFLTAGWRKCSHL